MLHTLFAGVLAVVAWLAWMLLGQFVGEVLGYLMRPVTRPLWQMIVRARYPWPLGLMLLTGVASSAGGLVLMRHDDWRGSAGLLLFFGGAGLALLAPLLWRDAKVEAARSAERLSRPVV